MPYVRLLMFSTLLVATATPLSAQVTVRLSAGATDAETFGANGEAALLIAERFADLFQAAEVAANLAYMSTGGGMPCPPDSDPPCPRGSEFIPHAVLNLGLLHSDQFTLRVTLGGGVAFGGEATPDGPSGTASEARTAGALVYGAAIGYRLSDRVSLFGQARGFSIFTGERTFVGPNGSFTSDVGTETKGLFSAGLGFRL